MRSQVTAGAAQDRSVALESLRFIALGQPAVSAFDLIRGEPRERKTLIRLTLKNLQTIAVS